MRCLTFPACVAAVRHGWTPSKVPTVTMRGLILWFSFSVNIGTNMAAKGRQTAQDEPLPADGRVSARSQRKVKVSQR